MSDMPSQETIEAAAEAAITLFLDRVGGGLSCGKFVLCIEAMDLDGDRYLWHSVGKGQTAWDSIGILQYLSNVELSQAVANRLDGA